MHRRRALEAAEQLRGVIERIEASLAGSFDERSMREELAALRTVHAELVELGEAEAMLGRAEAELEATRVQLQSVIGAIPIILWAIEPNGIITLSEGKGLASLGVRPGELVGRSAFEVYAPYPEAMEYMRLGLRGEVHTTRVVLGDLVFSNHYFPRFDAEGKVLELIGLSLDVTEVTRIEEESQKLEEQLRHTQKLESLGVLAGGIAHDFNNLLAVILGNVETSMRRLPSDAPARAVLETAERAAVRAAELTHQLLVYAGRSRVKIEPVDLDALVEELARLLGSVVAKNARIEIHLAPDLPLLMADPAQIRQLVMNLITNAAEALQGRVGTVELRTGLAPSEPVPGKDGAPVPWVFLEVRDDGVGMDEATVKRIFDPFFTTKFTGRGLGLAAVSGILRGHHGRLDVKSEPGRGTTFRVLLPAVAAVPSVDAPGSAPSPSHAKSAERGTVLVVDDDAAIRDMVGTILEDAGYETKLVPSGEEALAWLAETDERTAIALVDVVMPGMSGHELHRELLARHPELPVVLISGFELESSTQQAPDTPPPRLLAKPFTVEGLLEAIAAARKA